MWCKLGRVMGIALAIEPLLNEAALCLHRVLYTHRFRLINH